MAFQIGPHYLRGTIDDITFYKSPDGWLVRSKGGPDAKQFKTARAFTGSRKMCNELGYCSKIASAVRKKLMQNDIRNDKTLFHRLFLLARNLVKEDKVSQKGERRISNGLHGVNGQQLLTEFGQVNLLQLFLIAELEVQQSWIPPFKIHNKETRHKTSRNKKLRSGKKRMVVMREFGRAEVGCIIKEKNKEKFSAFKARKDIQAAYKEHLNIRSPNLLIPAMKRKMPY